MITDISTPKSGALKKNLKGTLIGGAWSRLKP